MNTCTDINHIQQLWSALEAQAEASPDGDVDAWQLLNALEALAPLNDADSVVAGAMNVLSGNEALAFRTSACPSPCTFDYPATDTACPCGAKGVKETISDTSDGGYTMKKFSQVMYFWNLQCIIAFEMLIGGDATSSDAWTTMYNTVGQDNADLITNQLEWLGGLGDRTRRPTTALRNTSVAEGRLCRDC